MNNQEIQIICGILLLLMYVYCIRNNEGYRRRGRTSCQTRPVVGRRIYKRVRPFRRCGSGRRGYISELKRVIVPMKSGQVPVNKGNKLFTGFSVNKLTTRRNIYNAARKGANYMEVSSRQIPRGKQTVIAFYKGASRATKFGGPSGTRTYRILPPGRMLPGGAFSRFIQRCKNMFRRRRIPVGDTQQMRMRRAALTPQQWARDDKMV